MRAWVLALILFPALAAIAYAPYLDAPFVFDDAPTIRDNPYLRTHLSPLYFFEHPEAASRIPARMIRPLLTFSYALDYHLFGPDPRPFRIVNLILHTMNALLVFALLRIMPRMRGAALWGGLLFLLHPLSSAQTAYVSNRSALLSSLFYLSALLVFAAAWREEQRGGLPRSRRFLANALTALLFALGLFTKEVIATLPAAVILWHLALSPGARGRGRDYRRDLGLTLAVTAALAAVFGAYLLYRRHFEAAVFFPPARPWPVGEYAAAQVRAFWTYIRLLVLPVNLSLVHDAWVPTQFSGLATAGFIASALALGLLLGVSLRLLRRAPEFSFAALFSMIYLLPTSSVVPLTVVVNENRPYLSTLIWLMPLLLVFEEARRKRPRVSAAFMGVILVCFLALIARRSHAYSDEITAWRDAVRKAPGSAQARVNLGAALLSYGRREEAGMSFVQALRLDPCSADALLDLGNVSYARGDWEGAKKYYEQALSCDPDQAVALTDLGELLMEQGLGEEGAALLARALVIYPTHSEILSKLGLYYAERGRDPKRARALMRKAAEFAPSEAEAQKWRSMALSLPG